MISPDGVGFTGFWYYSVRGPLILPRKSVYISFTVGEVRWKLTRDVTFNSIFFNFTTFTWKSCRVFHPSIWGDFEFMEHLLKDSTGTSLFVVGFIFWVMENIDGRWKAITSMRWCNAWTSLRLQAAERAKEQAQNSSVTNPEAVADAWFSWRIGVFRYSDILNKMPELIGWSTRHFSKLET